MFTALAPRRWIAGLIFLLWFLSLFFPVWDDASISGFDFLITGWMGVFIGTYSWLANFVLFIVVGLLASRRRYPVALIVFGALLLWAFVAEGTRTSIMDNEGGVTREISDRMAGFYLWMGSLGLGAAMAFAVGVQGLLGKRVAQGEAE